MWSIGEFAHASGLTPKALRLYDDLGLLTPAHVDPVSGYRSYTPDQWERARLIAWLRGLGMPLARIRVVCDLEPEAAAAEISSYWRQVEADTATRRQIVSFLVDHLSGKDTAMSGEPTRIRLHSAHALDRGAVRENNQDAALAGTALFAVADGFDSPALGESAATVALDALREADTRVRPGRIAPTLTRAFARARAAVGTFTARPAYTRAGTTLTAMLWSGPDLALAHIGDSRAYLLREGTLTRMTHDHTYVQSLVDEGRLTPDESTTHPQRSTLLRALHHVGSTGADRADDALEPDLHLRRARVDDRYLLCTDGVHAITDDTRLRHTLASATTPRQAAEEVVALAYAAGAPDNVACVVVDVHTAEH